jgi:hypothetical protein
MLDKRYDQLEPEERDFLARRGSCIVILLLPIVLICCVGLATYTGPGRVALSHTVLYAMANVNVAVPINGELYGVVSFAGAARRSCALDAANPRPATYDQQQEALTTRYATNLQLYRQYWAELRRSGGQSSSHETPEALPQNLTQAKRVYCEG